jgi:hypothetical protein
MPKAPLVFFMVSLTRQRLHLLVASDAFVASGRIALWAGLDATASGKVVNDYIIFYIIFYINYYIQFLNAKTSR